MHYSKDYLLDTPYSFLGRMIDPLSGTIHIGKQIKKIRRKELEILALLASTNKKVVKRSDFIEKLWDDNQSVGEVGLTQAIAVLRKTIEDHDKALPIIRTIPRKGYQLSCDIKIIKQPNSNRLIKGQPIHNRENWKLVKFMTKNDCTETWLAECQEMGQLRLFRFCTNEKHLQYLRREIKFLRYLGKVLSKLDRMVNIIDWQLENPPYYLEMSATTHGSLPEWLKNKGGLSQIDMSQRLFFLIEVAHALCQLHHVGVTHRNLNPHSLFVDNNDKGLTLKIGELGFSTLSDQSRLKGHDLTNFNTKLTSCEFQVSDMYTSPEFSTANEITIASDIYSFGVIIYQIFIGDINSPFSDQWQKHITDEGLKKLISECTHNDPKMRPQAANIVDQLQKIQSKFSQTLERRDEEKASKIVVQDNSDKCDVPGYRLLAKIGEGGMGSVYLAEQREPVERQVALKLIKQGLSSDQVLARFEVERQALALMDHSNVAAVFDAGSDKYGRPFFAMEYVPGTSIDQHCDKERLNIRSRVRLFLQVCDGLLHAHQKGIIHRDINPKNILVKNQGTESPVIKIIDFGVAKSLQSKLSSQTLHTQIGSFVGTPKYASPEQIDGYKGTIDTRSDIYSMGIVLFELLVGTTPYSDEDLADVSAVQMLRILTQETKPLPSKKLDEMDGETSFNVSMHRSTTIDRLKRDIKKETTWIILKCLENNPDNRYGSVLELKRDLERWLDHRPIEARKTNKIYALNKFIKRHRIAVSFAIVSSVALIATTTFSILGYSAAHKALASANIANKEAELSAEFIVENLQNVDPEELANRLRSLLNQRIIKHHQDAGKTEQEMTSINLQIESLFNGINFTDLALNYIDQSILETSLESIKKKLKDNPKLQAKLRQSIADTQRELGLYQKAVNTQNLALNNRLEYYGSNNPLTLESFQSRGQLNLALGNLDQAESDVVYVIDGYSKQPQQFANQILLAQFQLCKVYIAQGKYEQAEQLQRDVLVKQEEILGLKHEDTLSSYNLLGNILWLQFRFDEANNYYAVALKERTALLGAKHLDTLESINDMAALFWKQGKLEKAEQFYRQSLQGYNESLGEKHPNSLTIMNNLAMLLKKEQKFEESEEMLRKSLQIKEQSLGPQHPETIRTLANLASLLRAKGDLHQSYILYIEAIEKKTTALGKEHPSTLSTVNNMGFLSLDLHQYDKAEKYFTTALTGRLKVLGKDHQLSLRSKSNLATALRMKGDHDSSYKYIQETIAVQTKVLGATHADTMRSRTELAVVLQHKGAVESAEKAFREVIKDQTEKLGHDRLDTLLSTNHFINFLLDNGNNEEALKISQNLIDSSQSSINKKSHHYGVFWTTYGKALMANGQQRLAIESFQTAKQSLSMAGTAGQFHLDKLLAIID